MYSFIIKKKEKGEEEDCKYNNRKVISLSPAPLADNPERMISSAKE